MTGKEKPNRLINEKSPYLLQHAYNPVDWYPWCQEAFEAAKAQDKPVFLSVGYATCHWCHVMERESFEDPQVAAALNRDFICIKVDREERPDIDAVYMNATQLLTGGGGWPMSVFLDGQKGPLYAGTYFPKKDGVYGIGLLTLLERLRHVWQTDRPRLLKTSGEVIAALSQPDRKGGISYRETIQKGYDQLKGRYDPLWGGFGSAPKFPTPHNLMLLLRYHHLYQDPQALEMAEHSLTALYRGGIRDHLGLGFCRYSTDRKWLVPHFEKMLYDNALLATVYSEAHLVTGKLLYKRAAEEIFTYVLRDMTSPEGAFYSAEDADSEGEEGRFYTFTREEVLSVLGPEDGARFCRSYGMTQRGNFEGRNIPHLLENPDYEAVLADPFFADCRQKLFLRREERIRPLKDDKILSAWNGLMIYALSYAGRGLNRPDYVEAGMRAADFLLKHLRDEKGRLLTRYREGEGRFSGVAEDYAFVILGLIELYQASFQVRYLTEAYRLNEILLEEFWEDGALYQTGKTSEALIARPRELYDGALPSANSVSISNFVKLSHLCDAPELAEKAAEILEAFGADLAVAPIQFGFALCGMMLLDGAAVQIVLAGGPEDGLLQAANSAYQPFTTLAFADEALSQAFGFYKNYGGGDGRPAAYLCRGTHCEAPVFQGEALGKKLQEGRGGH